MQARNFPLSIQTLYAELLDQLAVLQVEAFPTGTTFRKREISDRKYWYAQEPTNVNGRPRERYVGPDTPEISNIISKASAAKDDANHRKTLIRSLVSAGLPRLDPLTANILEKLSQAGWFRLRGILIGTAAFQTYAGLLGVKLPNAAVRTGDVDVAQDYGVSLALDDAMDQPLLDILKSIEPQFTPIPSIADPAMSTSFSGPGGYRVDVLTTNRGAERDTPVKLPSLKTDALPLRHLDFLLRSPVKAAVLTRYGTLVTVPAPERYAVHKLIVAGMRKHSGNLAKAEKDIQQAGQLIQILADKSMLPELHEAYQEAHSRGEQWQRKLHAGRRKLTNHQDELLPNVR